MNEISCYLGKTLLLMAKVLLLHEQDENILFVCDSSSSSKIFCEKMKQFCATLKNKSCYIEIHSINLLQSDRDGKARFKSLIESRPNYNLVIDELAMESFYYVSHETRKLQERKKKVVCVIRPEETAVELSELSYNSYGFQIIHLTSNMRNTGRI